MRNNCIVSCAVLFLLLCALVDTSSSKKTKKNIKDEAKNMVFPPCASCKILVESFNKVIALSITLLKKKKISIANKYFL